MNKIEHTSAGGVNFEPNKKLGYYLLGNEIYYNKFQALLAEARQTEHKVKWFFNDHVFFKTPWTQEPNVALTELYRQRAQQLREKYDYIMLAASGGADSTSVIHSFLLNGIHLDEIVFRYPKQGEKNMVGNAGDTTCENTLAEWDYAAKPLFDWVSTNFPDTKLTVQDYTDDLLTNELNRDESWVFKSRHFLHPCYPNKHNTLALKENRELADTGKSICVLYGIDKPKICIKDGKFFIYFVDAPTGEHNPDVGDYTNITNEFFYWTPDFPEILVKQAQIIKNWFSMPQNHHLQHLLHWPNHGFNKRTVYEYMVKSLIYPTYDSNTFQVAKSSNNIYSEMDQWFHTNFADTQLYQSWQAGVNYILDNINEEHVSIVKGRRSNITMFNSSFYYLGDSTIPVPATTTLPIDKHVYNHVISGRLVTY